MFANTLYPYTKELDKSQAPSANEYKIGNIGTIKKSVTIIDFYTACSSLSNVPSQDVSFAKLAEYIRNDNKGNKALAMLKSFMDLVSAELTSEKGKRRVKESFYIVYGGLSKLSLDVLAVDISRQDESLFIYGEKKNTVFYYYFYIEDNNVETMVMIFTPTEKQIIEDTVSNSLRKLLNVLQHEETYEYIS